MGWLIDTVEASLRAEYSDVREAIPGYLIARSPSGPAPAVVLVGVSEREDGFGPGGAQATARAFTELVRDLKPDKSYLVLASGKGITAEARQQLTDLGVTRQGLIEFLDRFYSTTLTRQRGAYDPVQSFARLNRHLVTDRVSHRYQRISLDGLPLGIETSGDLFEDLFATLDGIGSGPRLDLVTGQAGGGKTVLFKALFASLYESFNEAKARHYGALYPRPVFFVPDYLKQAESYSFDTLVGAMFETVGALPVTPGYLDWLHTNGNVVLMFDGMDEFFARQTDLFDRLLATMTRPGSRARVVICARDSLLATNPALLQFLERVREACGPQSLEIVKLLKWDGAARRDLASLLLTGEKAAPGEPLEPVVQAFETRITQSPALTELTATPFFCDLLVNLYKEDDNVLPSDMLEILDRVLDRFLDREVAKLRGEELTEDQRAAALLKDDEAIAQADPLSLFASADERETLEFIRERLAEEAISDSGLVPLLMMTHADLGRGGILDLLAAAAHLHRRNPAGHGQGFDDETLQRLLSAHQGEGYEFGAEGERRFRAMLIFKQIALFSQRPGARSVDFTHEFIADHLAARHAANVLQRDPTAFAEAVGDLALERTEIFDRALARLLAQEAEFAADVRAALPAAMADQGPSAAAARFVESLLPAA